MGKLAAARLGLKVVKGEEEGGTKVAVMMNILNVVQ
jgi:hypothetical protein